MDEFQTQIQNFRKESKEIKKQVKQQTLTYILAGFALVAGLAWNEAIKELIDYLFPIKQNTLLAKFSYAILITLVVVMISMYLTRLLKEQDSQ